jgi:hypothetical protein
MPSVLAVLRLMAGPMRSGLMSQLGQKRRFSDVRVTSALPLKADIHRGGRHVRLVPGAAIGQISVSIVIERQCGAAERQNVPIFSEPMGLPD